MIIQGLWLQNFRNISDHTWKFNQGLNLYVAPNGSGKSNLIEAIRLLSTGRSWRAHKTEDFISWGEDVAHLQAKVKNYDGEEVTIQQTLSNGHAPGRRAAARTYKVNGVGKRRSGATSLLATILFAPEDMLVFQVGPSARRQLLDDLLFQTDQQYARSLQQYDKALRRRNKLISQLREGEVDRYDFFYWDKLLIEHGSYLQQKRQNLIEWLSERDGITDAYNLVYDQSVISAERLHQYANAEVGAGHTLVGPHKDDWQLQVMRGGQWQDIVQFGSRGEQRLSLLWFKLQAVEYMKERLHEKPVLLLDDVFSELDEKNCDLFLSATSDLQAIITTVPGQEIRPNIAQKLET